MKSITLTPRNTTAMLQNLRARKLQLDRAIRELEAYAAASGILPPEPPRPLHTVPPADDSHEQWLQ
jgi:hypothetical protein